MSDQPNRPGCEHLFKKDGWIRFLRQRRYVCVRCGLVTRHYDGLDATMTRPVHRHMSVAFKGFNTTGSDESRTA